MKTQSLFLPSEWHTQSGVMLTWPHGDTDWSEYLDEAETCFTEIACAIASRETLVVVTPDPAHVKTVLAKKLDVSQVRFVEAPTNDTWARDHGAITIIENGKPVICDFMFNGWGLKFASDKDNLITRVMHNEGVFSSACSYRNRLNFILEGGSIESNGKGTLLTTSECLLSPNRNGEWDRARIEKYLIENFGLKKVVWIDHGYLAGDDTDSHIDTLARLCPDDTILYVKCDDTSDEHYDALARMEQDLAASVTADGKPFTLVPLPMAEHTYFDGDRLPATYANFLIINGAVLVPSYNSPVKDEEARRAVAKVFPDREVILIDCSVLIRQHGSLHCVTMQFPDGVIE